MTFLFIFNLQADNMFIKQKKYRKFLFSIELESSQKNNST